MKTKKSPRANLENKRFIFGQIGMIVTLLLVILAFEWKTYDNGLPSINDRWIDKTPEDVALITQQIKTPPPPKPVPITTVINIIGDDDDFDDDLFIDVGADDYTEIPLYNPDIKDDGDDDIKDDIPFIAVEEDPSFPGGDEARLEYLKLNTRYPLLARETGIAGNVIFSFVVERDGSISNIELLKGIGGGCDEEAYRVIKNMPRWNPGKQRGHPVRVKLTMHIEFKLL